MTEIGMDVSNAITTPRSFDLPAFVEYLPLSFYKFESDFRSNIRLPTFPCCRCFCACDDPPLRNTGCHACPFE
jgi:hypothetical protein